MYPRRILLLSDSRGHGLKTLVNYEIRSRPIDNVRFDVLAESGLKIRDTVTYFYDELAQNQYDFIILMAGVNNLTCLHESSRVTPTFDDMGHMIDIMTDHYTWAKDQLEGLNHTVVMSQLIGLDIGKWNGVPGEFPFHQDLIEKGLPYINQVITSFNVEVDLYGPWVLNTVHHRQHGDLNHDYTNLYDGIHATHSLKAIWASRIADTIEHNLKKLP